MPQDSKTFPTDLEILTLGEFQRAFVDYKKQPNVAIHAVVNSCLLLEICHKGADGEKTCSSITHIPKSFILIGQDRITRTVR